MDTPSSAERSNVTREELVQTLKENGFDDPDAITLFGNWIQELHDLEAENPTNENQIEINLQIARVYLEVGHTKDALEVFEEALDQALQYKHANRLPNDDLITKIDKEIAEARKML